MIPLDLRPDVDCNLVTLTPNPNTTLRCSKREGHLKSCGQFNVMQHKHRRPTLTVTGHSFYRGRHNLLRSLDCLAAEVRAVGGVR